MLKNPGHILGGSLLVSGVTIGVGTLAMPLATAPCGFLPAVSLYLVCWLFMLCTGLLLLEVCLWMPINANIITMAKTLLGMPGKIIAWISYLFVFFLIEIAHMTIGSSLFAETIGGIAPLWVSTLLYALLFTPFVYLGTLGVDRANLVLMAGLLLSFFFFAVFAIPLIDFSIFQHINWKNASFALPILFTAFCYQMIIPTLVNYLGKDIKKSRLCLFIGTGLPFFIYIIWEFIILGIIPSSGPNSLMDAASKGDIPLSPLKILTGYSYFSSLTGHKYLFFSGKLFAFFATTCSFIIFSLAYLDFLADGLKWQKTPRKKFILCCLIFLPPMIITMIFPTILLKVASIAGGLFSAILFGLFPPLMVWIGRHFHKYPDQTRQLFGGRYFLSLLILFVTFEITITIITEFIKS
jgi:tyrosine-specific transport protein